MLINWYYSLKLQENHLKDKLTTLLIYQKIPIKTESMLY